MTWAATNVTGWSELYNGHPIDAVFLMYNTALMGWTVAILFLLFQFMLFLKTRNPVIAFVTGVIFISMYLTSTFVTAISTQVMMVLLVLELACVLYLVFIK